MLFLLTDIEESSRAFKESLPEKRLSNASY